MGYTHYWDNTEAFTTLEFRKIRRVLMTVAAWADEIPLEITLDSRFIHINGTEDDAHETFCIQKRVEGDFCKTNRKPYDAVVVASLMLISEMFPDKFSWSSDGEEGCGDFEAAHELANLVKNLDFWGKPNGN